MYIYVAARLNRNVDDMCGRIHTIMGGSKVLKTMPLEIKCHELKHICMASCIHYPANGR